MTTRRLNTFLLAVVIATAFLSSFTNAADPIIWKLRDANLRWARDRKEWERTAIRLARNSSIGLHLNKVDSARAAYFEAVVLGGDKVIEYCLVLLRGRDSKGKRNERFVLMGRTPYEGTGEWEISWAIVEPPHPKAPNMDGVLPVDPQTSQADIWSLLESFDACPSAQPKSEHYVALSCVIFEDLWQGFVRPATPDKPAETLDESKLKQPESRIKK